MYPPAIQSHKTLKKADLTSSLFSSSEKVKMLFLSVLLALRPAQYPFCGCKGTHIILHTQHPSPLFYDYLTILQRFTTVRHTPSPNNNLLSADDVDTTRQSFEGCCLSTYHLAQHGIHIERLPADQQIDEKDSTCTVERM